MIVVRITAFLGMLLRTFLTQTQLLNCKVIEMNLVLSTINRYFVGAIKFVMKHVLIKVETLHSLHLMGVAVHRNVPEAAMKETDLINVLRADTYRRETDALNAVIITYIDIRADVSANMSVK